MFVRCFTRTFLFCASAQYTRKLAYKCKRNLRVHVELYVILYSWKLNIATPTRLIKQSKPHTCTHSVDTTKPILPMNGQSKNVKILCLLASLYSLYSEVFWCVTWFAGRGAHMTMAMGACKICWHLFTWDRWGAGRTSNCGIPQIVPYISTRVLWFQERFLMSHSWEAVVLLSVLWVKSWLFEKYLEASLVLSWTRELNKYCALHVDVIRLDNCRFLAL